MATTLKSQLEYTTVAAGATAVLSHNLNVQGFSRAPDEISFENQIFDYVSHTSTTLTVVNNGAVAASCRVLCELWHTFERVFGDGSQNLPSKPFVNRGVDLASAGAVDQVFTYTCTGAEGSDFVITLPAARADDDYVPQVTCGGTTAIYGVDCPDLIAGDRTTTQFRVVTSAAVQLADRLDVTIQQRT